MINLSEFNYSMGSKKKLKEKIMNIKNKINNLDIIKQGIINQINILKESSELEMKFIEILLYSYEYEDKQNNLNYKVIQNLKKFEKQFKSKKYKYMKKFIG